MSKPRDSISDSPWLWAYLFGTVGLALVWISAPTWIARQARIERRAVGAREARETMFGAPSTKPSPDSTVVAHHADALRDYDDDVRDIDQQQAVERATFQLRTLVTILGIGIVLAWIGWFRQRRGQPHDLTGSTESSK